MLDLAGGNADSRFHCAFWDSGAWSKNWLWTKQMPPRSLEVERSMVCSSLPCCLKGIFNWLRLFLMLVLIPQRWFFNVMKENILLKEIWHTPVAIFTSVWHQAQGSVSEVPAQITKTKAEGAMETNSIHHLAKSIWQKKKQIRGFKRKLCNMPSLWSILGDEGFWQSQKPAHCLLLFGLILIHGIT